MKTEFVQGLHIHICLIWDPDGIFFLLQQQICRADVSWGSFSCCLTLGWLELSFQSFALLAATHSKRQRWNTRYSSIPELRCVALTGNSPLVLKSLLCSSFHNPKMASRCENHHFESFPQCNNHIRNVTFFFLWQSRCYFPNLAEATSQLAPWTNMEKQTSRLDLMVSGLFQCNWFCDSMQ